ncbi:MAG: glycosyltransferase, partial [Cytophagales bacterium]
IASQFDIGMALEQNIPYNRDICLTNKIFTYLASGIAVIASETEAQKQFMQSYPAIGKSYPIDDVEKLAEIMQYYFENRADLQKAKEASFALGKDELNWEKESEKFIRIIAKVLSE